MGYHGLNLFRRAAHHLKSNERPATAAKNTRWLIHQAVYQASHIVNNCRKPMGVVRWSIKGAT